GAGTGHPQPQAAGGAGWGGAAQSRQWPTAWPTDDLGWAGQRAGSAVHGHHGGGALEPLGAGVVRTSTGRGQAAQGGAGGVHAQAAQHLQRRAAAPNSLEVPTLLTFKTVATLPLGIAFSEVWEAPRLYLRTGSAKECSRGSRAGAWLASLRSLGAGLTPFASWPSGSRLLWSFIAQAPRRCVAA